MKLNRTNQFITIGDNDLEKIDEYLDQFYKRCRPEINLVLPPVEVSHKETLDRNYFYAKCPFCETKNSITFNPEAEVQFRTCEKCEKQFIADWSKVR